MSELLIQPEKERPKSGWGLRMWRWWTFANAIGELLGLGTSALLGVILIGGVNPDTILGSLIVAAIMIAAGAFVEGAAVGIAQWSVLRQALPTMKWQKWVVATAVGAGAAWTLGMIPSTLITISANSSSAPPGKISDLLTYALAALMGLFLGPILGLPQWWVLRRHVPQAGWWILANSLAWAVGMPIIFIGIGNALSDSGASVGVTTVLILILTLFLAGAAVGGVHGFVLIRLLEHKSKLLR